MPDDKDKLLNAVEPWQNLWDLPQAASASSPVPRDSGAPLDAQGHASAPAGALVPDLNLRDEAKRLALDCIPYPFDGCVERIKRLGLSSRKFEQAKRDLVEKGLVRVMGIGQTDYLVGTETFYEALGLEPPRMKRRLSFEHGFAVRLAHHLCSRDPLVRRVEMEVPVGSSGATVDLVVHTKDGSREAVEVTLSVGNVAANAAKCQDKGFCRIVFLARQSQVRQAAWARLRESGLPPDLLGRCRVVLFSALAKRIKQVGR